PSGLRQGLQRSFQTSLGIERDLGDETRAKVTGFHAAMFGLTDPLGTSGTSDVTDERLRQRSIGSSAGVEVFLRRRLTRRLGGFVAYTLSRSVRSAGKERYPSAFDRTHVLSAAVAYDLGRGVRAGARWMFYTGIPLQERGTFRTLAEHPERTPPFNRIDLRIE